MSPFQPDRTYSWVNATGDPSSCVIFHCKGVARHPSGEEYAFGFSWSGAADPATASIVAYGDQVTKLGWEEFTWGEPWPYELKLGELQRLAPGSGQPLI